MEDSLPFACLPGGLDGGELVIGLPLLAKVRRLHVTGPFVRAGWVKLQPEWDSIRSYLIFCLLQFDH